jgi:hypothetical protein
VEVACELGGGGPFPVREFPEQARLGQGERRLDQVLVQDADASGVEAVEAADGLGARAGW